MSAISPPHQTLTRRRFVAGSAGILTGAMLTQPQAQTKDVEDLRPGQFTWHPDRAASGPIAIIVSIPDQRVHVYRNGVRIGVSTCSTGKAGHETPTGVFTILQKDWNHKSSTYSNAPMPNMLRLTWSGIALHAGKLPGYPTSHGCVRLPMAFSQNLFSVTHVGGVVILADAHSQPTEVLHPGLILDPAAERQFALRGHAGPDDAAGPSLSIVVSRHDRRVAVLEDGVLVAEGNVTIRDPGRPLGSHVFLLSRGDNGGALWHAFSHRDTNAADIETFNRLGAEGDTLASIRTRIHIGTTLTTTDLPLHPDSRSGRDFVIMNTDET